MNTKLVVDLAELEKCLRYLREINQASFRDIIWQRDGQPMIASEESLEYHETCGLNNRDFPSCMGWIEDGLGIKVHTLFLGRKPKD